MKLLFIKLKFIGDTLLLTPTLTAARQVYPGAEIWVVVRRGCEGILEGCAAADRVLVTASPYRELRSRWDWMHDCGVATRIAARRFDYAFELGEGDRGRRLAVLSAARIRCARQTRKTERWLWRRAFSRLVALEVAGLHRVEWDYQTVRAVLPLPVEIPPLAFSPERAREPSGLRLGSAYAVLHPFGRVAFRKWPGERWVALGSWLAEMGLKVVVSSGLDPAERSEAWTIVEEIGPGAVSTDGGLDWRELAFVLHHARLFVGVDTSVMHLAAACACPTVAIFGKAAVSEWRPWKVPHRVVTPPEEIVQVARAKSDLPVLNRITAYVTLNQVQRACDELLAETCGG